MLSDPAGNKFEPPMVTGYRVIPYGVHVAPTPKYPSPDNSAELISRG